jgi:hypothetical protein
VLIVMLERPSSRASVLARLITPPREAAVMASRGCPTRAESPTMLTILPPPRWAMRGAAAWQQFSTP